MTITDTDPTILRLWGIGVPPYSARGLTQTLVPVDQAISQRRTINGTLHDLSASQFRKYRSTISGADQRPPAVDGVWPGHIVLVDCIAELCHPEYTDAERPAVENSEYEETGFLFYRPRLNMMVENFNLSQDEYGRQIGWQMDLVEI